MESIELIVWVAQQVLAPDLVLVKLMETGIGIALVPVLVLAPDFLIVPEKVSMTTQTSWAVHAVHVHVHGIRACVANETQ